jgi:hypothetical protein
MDKPPFSRALLAAALRISVEHSAFERLSRALLRAALVISASSRAAAGGRGTARAWDGYPPARLDRPHPPDLLIRGLEIYLRRKTRGVLTG